MFESAIRLIEKARIKAYKSLTNHQLSLNFELGKLIVDSQEKYGWGKSIVDDLSKDMNSGVKARYVKIKYLKDSVDQISGLVQEIDSKICDHISGNTCCGQPWRKRYS